jgi:hypothetical protein
MVTLLISPDLAEFYKFVTTYGANEILSGVFIGGIIWRIWTLPRHATPGFGSRHTPNIVAGRQRIWTQICGWAAVLVILAAGWQHFKIHEYFGDSAAFTPDPSLIQWRLKLFFSLICLELALLVFFFWKASAIAPAQKD